MKDITIQIAKANLALDAQYRELTNPTDKIKNRTVHTILCKVSDMVDPDDDYFDYDLDSDVLYKLQDEIITSVRDILTACINSNNR